jgi:hypothetical protein
VKVVVKRIPEEAVDLSGSLRMANITAEEFIELSKREELQKLIAKILNVSLENVDVFTAMNSKGEFLDVRYSAHGSPYYQPEKLNGKLSEHQTEVRHNFLKQSKLSFLKAHRKTEIFVVKKSSKIAHFHYFSWNR